jgi:hypothetical protein
MKVYVLKEMNKDFWEALNYIQNEFSMSQQANFNEENDIEEIDDFEDGQELTDELAIIDKDTLELYLDNIVRHNLNFELDYNEFLAQKIIKERLEIIKQDMREDRNLICISVKNAKEDSGLIQANMKALNHEDDFYNYLSEELDIDLDEIAFAYAKELNSNVRFVELDHNSGDSVDNSDYYDNYYTLFFDADVEAEAPPEFS